MSHVPVILKEEHMSTAEKVSADTAVSLGARRDHRYLWTTVLVLGAIAACAIGASFYVVAPLVDASMVGP